MSCTWPRPFLVTNISPCAILFTGKRFADEHCRKKAQTMLRTLIIYMGVVSQVITLEYFPCSKNSGGSFLVIIYDQGRRKRGGLSFFLKSETALQPGRRSRSLPSRSAEAHTGRPGPVPRPEGLMYTHPQPGPATPRGAAAPHPPSLYLRSRPSSHLTSLKCWSDIIEIHHARSIHVQGSSEFLNVNAYIRGPMDYPIASIQLSHCLPWELG